MLSGLAPNGNEAEPPGKEPDAETASLIELLMRQARGGELDQIAEPTAADLAAIDELDDFDDMAELDEPLSSPDLNPALSLLAEIEEPEFVSLEGLDDAEELDEIDEDLDEAEELLDDAEGLIEDFYLELDLKDEELEDEGYDLDDDDAGSYRDLYGDDDAIIPSFREGEFAEEDEGDSAYYDDLR